MRVEILDAAGRRVRDLGSRLLDAGPQVIGWDGDDDSGRKVGAGIYLVRVTTPEGAIKGKLARLGQSPGGPPHGLGVAGGAPPGTLKAQRQTGRASALAGSGP